MYKLHSATVADGLMVLTQKKLASTCTGWAYNGYCNDSRIVLDGSTGTNNRQID